MLNKESSNLVAFQIGDLYHVIAQLQRAHRTFLLDLECPTDPWWNTQAAYIRFNVNDMVPKPKTTEPSVCIVYCMPLLFCLGQGFCWLIFCFAFENRANHNFLYESCYYV